MFKRNFGCLWNTSNTCSLQSWITLIVHVLFFFFTEKWCSSQEQMHQKPRKKLWNLRGESQGQYKVFLWYCVRFSVCMVHFIMNGNGERAKCELEQSVNLSVVQFANQCERYFIFSFSSNFRVKMNREMCVFPVWWYELPRFPQEFPIRKTTCAVLLAPVCV